MLQSASLYHTARAHSCNLLLRLVKSGAIMAPFMVLLSCCLRSAVLVATINDERDIRDSFSVLAISIHDSLTYN